MITVEGTRTDANGRKQTDELELWKRNAVDIVREIIGNPALRAHIYYAPTKIFTNEKCNEQIFNEMRTAEWW